MSDVFSHHSTRSRGQAPSRPINPATSRAYGAAGAARSAQYSYGDAGPQVVELLLGRYRVLESRATGGFGTVELCWDTRLQRRVAIKCMPLLPPGALMHAELDPRYGTGAYPGQDPYQPQVPVEPTQSALDHASVAEALAEARTASMLSHPNIVSVYDFDFDGTYAYLVMEYVDGLTLGELLSRVEGGTLTPQEVSHIMDRVAEALTFAHENGVLHLDIKPSNILIDHNGNPRICDFGMATLASAAGFGDARGGTVGYMPPEQIEGDLVDERTDLFALAVCTLQALIGTNPFAAARAEDSEELILNGAIDALAALQLECGARVGEAVAAALTPDQSVRTASVKRFADELVPALGDAEAGLASLKELLAQATDDEPAPPMVYGRPLTLNERAPWLPFALRRALVAAACMWCVATTLPLYMSGGDFASDLSFAVVTLLAGAFGAALPALGSGLATSALMFRLMAAAADKGVSSELLAQQASFGVAPAAIAGVACVVLGFWWWRWAREQELALPALLLPLCMGPFSFPSSVVALVVWGCRPLAAAVTSAVSLFMYLLLAPTAPMHAQELGLTIGVTAGSAGLMGLVRVASTLSFWVVVAGVSLSAFIGSWLCRARGRRQTGAQASGAASANGGPAGAHAQTTSTNALIARGICGQLVALIGTVACFAATQSMEFAGIWSSFIEPVAGFALLWSVLMCAAGALLGCSHTRQEE